MDRAHPEITAVRKLLAEELGVRSFAERNGWRFEHPQRVTRLVYTQGGSVLITGCADGRIRFFDTSAGTALEPSQPARTGQLENLGGRSFH